MGKEPTLKYPWQKTPTQLIQYAEGLMKEERDFENQLAFLLIDIGVETIFITYLSLPNDVIGAKTKHGARMNLIAKNSFHVLLKGVEETAGQRLENLDLNRVLYFHNIRNKLYHRGDGIVAKEENLQEYMEISKFLLKVLLDVDLSRSFEEMVEAGFRNVNVHMGAEWISKEIGKSLVDMRLYAGMAMERYKPDWATRSFEKSLKDIWEKYPDDESDLHWQRTENQDNRFRIFNDLIGLEIDDYGFVDNCLKDISYLHLTVTAQKLHRNTDQDLQNYLEACQLLNNLQFREFKDIEEYGDTRKKADEIISWIGILQEEIEKLLDEQNDK